VGLAIAISNPVESCLQNNFIVLAVELQTD
jgi:hypothetical protein